MAEWSNAPVLKTGVPHGTGGSNPSLSATYKLLNMHKTTLYYKLSVYHIIENYDKLSKEDILVSLNKMVEDDKTSYRPTST